MIVVLGANGQVGFELKRILKDKAIYLTREKANLNDPKCLENIFKNYQVSSLINAAAYTKVDKAEEDKEEAYKINAIAPGILAELCKNHSAKLLHFSTDYVFNGQSETPYLESDPIDPINYYGETKAQGEKNILSVLPRALIFRTSWVYSSHGHNFVKTMLNLGQSRDELRVVCDQVGSPTWAYELAKVSVLALEKGLTGIYHYSQEGRCSWADFALEIKKMTSFKAKIIPIKTSEYPTIARRPSFSLLSKEKITNDLNLSVPDWKESLELMLQDFSKTS